MAAIASSNNLHSSPSPKKPSSPASPSPQSMNHPPPRSFIHLNQGVRGQHSPFPTTPTSSHAHSILEPPPAMSYSDFIRTWTDNHVARWLTDIKCAHHATAFKANDIRGDIVLELDQTLLKEMGIASIGDRLRIINAVKALRQRSSSRPAHASIIDISRPKLDQITEPRTPAIPESSGADGTTMRGPSRGGRPAPLQLNPNINRDSLPRLEPDSASRQNHNPIVRPLPQPSSTASQSSTQPTGNSHTIVSSTSRTNLPPLPPPPGKPPPPPTNRPPARPPNGQGSNDRRPPPQSDPGPPPPYTTQPLHLPPSREHLTPSPGSNRTGHPPNDLRPVNSGSVKNTAVRSTSPLLVGRITRPLVTNTTHGRNGSLGLNSPVSSNIASKLPPRPSTSNSHPYATATAQLAPTQPQSQAHNLSPIAESFLAQHTPIPGTPSPPSVAYTVGRGSFNPNGNSNGTALPLDALRRKLVKFMLPDEGLASTIDVATCAGGVEVLEKVLKKFGKSGSRGIDTDGGYVQMEEGGLSIDGWGVYMGMGNEDGPGTPLTEAELLTICHAPPDHPSREHGLTVRKVFRRHGSSSPQSKFLNTSPASKKNTKRASSISVLSGLGVSDPEKALDPPSPTSGALNSAAHNAKRPSKLHNFFGQRPPSELITNHLPDYFPSVEKKVLERTARNSMMLRTNLGSSRRDSTMSRDRPLPSRFSSSTQGSLRRSSISPTRSCHSSAPPPAPTEKNASSSDSEKDSPGEDIPRMSLSTDDGRSVELHPDDVANPSTTSTSPQLLPPIPTTNESFSESFGSITGHRTSRSPSRVVSTASRRMSYMTELRSKRDRSDTASLMTVDEITAEVESRRASMSVDQGSDTDDWTQVSEDEVEDETMEETLNEEADEVDDTEEATCVNGDDGDGDDDDDQPRGITSKGANKWIKGALIGAGSFGKVYLGMDASNGLLMAVKQVELPTGSAPNQERKKNMLSALEREIELLKNLQHANIVQYLYSSIDDEYLNIFLEYVPGGSVTALLHNYGAFEETLVKNFVRQILAGLTYLHERDIIHRDIKGGNILVDNKGGIKISDFGISKKIDDNLLTGNRANRPSLQGSVFWMAPEVVKQSIYTKKADIWSVGCLIVEMLTGDHPWAQLSQMQAIYQIGSSAKPTIPSDISSDAQNFLQLTFETNHEARPSAPELSQHSWIAQKPTKRTNLEVMI